MSDILISGYHNVGAIAVLYILRKPSIAKYDICSFCKNIIIEITSLILERSGAPVRTKKLVSWQHLFT